MQRKFFGVGLTSATAGAISREGGPQSTQEYSLRTRTSSESAIGDTREASTTNSEMATLTARPQTSSRRLMRKTYFKMSPRKVQTISVARSQVELFEQ
jgi:Flp pilus assembly protein TadD